MPLRPYMQSRTQRRATCCARRPSSQVTVRATVVVYAFSGAGPAQCAAYTRAVGASEVLVPLGPVISAFPAFGLAASNVNVIRELPDPGVAPLDLPNLLHL